MNAVTKAVELTEFQTVVLAAMRTGGGFGTSREIAELAGFKPEPVLACLAKLSDRGLTYAEPSLKKGEPPTWYLAETATPSPSANDGTPGDDEPAPEPGDTQAVEASEPTLMSDTAELQPSVEPVAETQAAEADADGWIPWRGGECPVPVGSRCSIRLRNADVAHCIRAPEAWWWGRAAERTAALSDIIAYRPEPKQTGPASFDDPDDYGDDEIPPAAAYDATVEAEAKAGEAPLIGEAVNSEADVIEDRRERYTDPVEAAAEQIAAAVAAGHCPTVALLIQRAIDAAEAEAQAREKEADIALEMARDARVRGRAVAEIIRLAEQRTGLAGDADPDVVLAAIAELLDGARSAVTGMSLPA